MGQVVPSYLQEVGAVDVAVEIVIARPADCRPIGHDQIAVKTNAGRRRCARPTGSRISIRHGGSLDDKLKEAKPSMTITELSEEQRACFKEAAAQVEAKFIEMTGDSGQAILDQMKADLEATDPDA